MGLALLSINLLKEEIKKIESMPSLDKQQEFYLTVAKKEVSLLEKLNIECDMRGTEEELDCRLKANMLILMAEVDWEKYKKTFDLYNKIKKELLEMEL